MQIEKANEIRGESRECWEARGEEEEAPMWPQLWNIFPLLGGLIISSVQIREMLIIGRIHVHLELCCMGVYE